MKFLCVPCDQPMRLTTVRPPVRGSLSVVYSCAACGYEMAMLTNPYETQVVASLGVKIAPEAGAAVGPAGATGTTATTIGAGAAAAGAGTTDDAQEGGGKCPFAGMIPGLMSQGAESAATTEQTAGGDAAGAVAALGYAAAGATDAGAGAPAWTDAASARLEVIPSFVRPMARTGIERFARERGYATIDEKVLDEARAFFGM